MLWVSRLPTSWTPSTDGHPLWETGFWGLPAVWTVSPCSLAHSQEEQVGGGFHSPKSQVTQESPSPTGTQLNWRGGGTVFTSQGVSPREGDVSSGAQRSSHVTTGHSGPPTTFLSHDHGTQWTSHNVPPTRPRDTTGPLDPTLRGDNKLPMGGTHILKSLSILRPLYNYKNNKLI